MDRTIDRLLSSPEPSIRYKTRVRVLGEPEGSAAILQLQQEIKSSGRVRALLCTRDARGRVEPVQHNYKKWRAHIGFSRRLPTSGIRRAMRS